MKATGEIPTAVLDELRRKCRAKGRDDPARDDDGPIGERIADPDPRYRLSWPEPSR